VRLVRAVRRPSGVDLAVYHRDGAVRGGFAIVSDKLPPEGPCGVPKCHPYLGGSRSWAERFATGARRQQVRRPGLVRCAWFLRKVCED
jgi:hypothetical protein